MEARSAIDRRGRRRTAALAVTLVFVILFGAPFLLLRVDAVRNWAIDRALAEANLLRRPWILRLEDLPRFDPWGAHLEGIRVVYAEGGRERDWLAIRSLEIRWSLRDLLRRRIFLEDLAVEGAVLRIDLPAPQGGEDETPEDAVPGRFPRLPWIRVDSGRFEFELRDQGRRIASGRLALADLEHRSSQIRCDLTEFAGRYDPESFAFLLEHARVEGALPGTIRIEGARFSSAGIDAHIDGDLRASGDSGAASEATLICNVASLRPAILPFVGAADLPFAAGDSLRGVVRLEKGARGLGASLSLEGRLFDAPLEGLRMVGFLAADTVRLEGLDLRHRLGQVSADGIFLIGPRKGIGRVALARVNLADPSLARWLPGVPSTDLSGRLAGEAAFDSAGLSADLEGTFDRVRFERLASDRAGFRVRIRDGRLEADTLWIGPDGAGLRGGGSWRIPDGPLSLDLRLDGLPLDRWADPFAKVGLAGAVQGRVGLWGRLDSLAVQGRFQAEKFRVVDVAADRVGVDSVFGTLAPIRLIADLRAGGLRVYGVPLDSARISFDWDETMKVAVSARSDTMLAWSDLELVPADPGFLTIQRLGFQSGSGGAWSSVGEPLIAWSRGSVGVSDLRIESEAGNVSAEISVGANQGALVGLVRIDDLDLYALQRMVGLPDSALAGILDLDGRILGTTERPAFDLSLEARDLLVDRWAVGEARARIGCDEGGMIRIDSLSARGAPGHGALDIPFLRVRSGAPLPRFIESLRDSIGAALADARIDGRIRVGDLSLSRMVRTAMETTPARSGALFVQSIDPMTHRVRTIRPGEEPRPQTVAEGVEGTLAFDLSIGGGATAPTATIRGRIDQLRILRARADSVLFAASFADSSIQLDSLLWHRGGRASRARGSLPAHLSLVPGGSGVRMDAPIAFESELPEIDLALVGLLAPEISDPEGFLSGKVVLRGTPRRIWPEGELTLRKGGLRIPKREERIRDIEGTLRLDSTGVRIAGLEGRIGPKGRAKLRGRFLDLSDFDLEGEVRSATIYETGLYRFIVDGDFRAYPVESGSEAYPLIVGSVDLLEGAIVGDLAKAPPPPAGATKQPSPWRAEIDIFCPGNIRLQTPIASVELGEAENLHVSFDDPELNFGGGIRVLGGRYRVFNNVFTITSGTVEFRDTGSGVVEPILDVEAETQVHALAPGESGAQTERITIHVTGPISALQLEFSSERGLPSDEIISLLSIGRWRDPESGSWEVRDPSTQYLFTEVVSQIESEITQVITPLQNVSVRPGDSPGAAWELNLRQTILPQVSLAYSRELRSEAGQEVSVHYNLRGQLYLNAAVERRQEEGAPADRYSLDLKMRFEYK